MPPRVRANMTALAFEGRGRWWAATGIALFGTAVALALVALASVTPPPAPATAGATRPAVKIARADDADVLLKEEAELRDLRPLFLPTSRNAALPEPKLVPGRSMLDRDSLRSVGAAVEVQLGAELPAVATIGGRAAAEATPLQALSAETMDPGLLGLGRRASPVTPMAERGGFVEVTAMIDGRRIWAEELSPAARPAGDRVWSPLEMMAVVDRAGLASPLVVTEGSRVEEVDLHFKQYLTQVLRIGERLSAGSYRIVIAP